jgi:hypothetical protein
MPALRWLLSRRSASFSGGSTPERKEQIPRKIEQGLLRASIS